MSEELLDLAIAAAGGHQLWRTLQGLKIDISIGGPIWAMNGWPPGKTFDQVLTLDTTREQVVFSPFTRPDRQMEFDAGSDSVTMQTLDGDPVKTLAPHAQPSRECCATAPGTPRTLATSWATRAGTTSPPRFCSPIPMCRPAKSNYGARPARLGGAVRRVFRRNPDNTVNLNLLSITLDSHDVELMRCGDERARP
jgi:hypothetical protein